ncbi:hypothetical protein [Sporolactobacillus putidus]|uniref:hypothetical protein n=1 Tax=Sporolactobacillus putidus TaxID=492735 RepID=UPI00166E05FB|nr:hypothetical protein [Sporolactobacillus putidus]
MGFVWIIFAVIAFIFYVARSVEKQNAQERARREARRGRRTAVFPPADQAQGERHLSMTSEENAENGEPDTEPLRERTTGSTERRTLLQEASDRLARSEQKTMPSSRRRIPGRNVSGTSSEKVRPGWTGDRRRVRQAFLFAVCIGKPRALEPHAYFRKRNTH